MPPFLQFVIRRFLVVPVALLVVTMTLYGGVFAPPTLAVMIFGIAWNMLGDGLSDVLDPHSL